MLGRALNHNGCSDVKYSYILLLCICLNFNYFMTIERQVKDNLAEIFLVGCGQDISVVLMWEETRVHRENPPVHPGEHKPSQVLTPGIEPQSQW